MARFKPRSSSSWYLRTTTLLQQGSMFRRGVSYSRQHFDEDVAERSFLAALLLLLLREPVCSDDLS